jgi:hypothetical protein
MQNTKIFFDVEEKQKKNVHRKRITGNESEARSLRIYEENSDSDSGQRKIELSNFGVVIRIA